MARKTCKDWALEALAGERWMSDMAVRNRITALGGPDFSLSQVWRVLKQLVDAGTISRTTEFHYFVYKSPQPTPPPQGLPPFGDASGVGTGVPFQTGMLASSAGNRI